MPISTQQSLLAGRNKDPGHTTYEVKNSKQLMKKDRLPPAILYVRHKCCVLSGRWCFGGVGGLGAIVKPAGTNNHAGQKFQLGGFSDLGATDVPVDRNNHTD
eukprot:1159603-Pelagomonas_calceolata.AAC.6